MNEPVRRRRRVRSPGEPEVEAGPAEPEPVVLTAGVADEAPPWVVEVTSVEADAIPAERGLRGLVGGGSSQVSPAAAMRARDAARPRAEDLARAEAELTIVRRHWTPRD